MATSQHHESAQAELGDKPRTSFEIKAAAQFNTDFEHEMTLRQAIRLYPKAIFFVFVLSLSIIMEGYDIGLVPSLWAQPAFRKKYGVKLTDGSYQLKSTWQSLLTALVQLGSIFGYWVSGFLIDRFGYKKTLHGCLLSITGFIFIIFFAPNVEALIVGEGLLGIPWGIIQTLTTTYAAEVVPIALRPFVTTYICLCWMIGGFISTGVLRGFVNVTTEWAYRIPFGLQWIWPVPIMVAVAFAPDSPWWLVRMGRLEDAKQALLKLTTKSNVNYDVDAVVAMISNTIEMERIVGHDASYKSCFKGTNLRRTEITCVAGAVPCLAGSSFGGLVVYFLNSAGLPAVASYNVGIGMSGVSSIGVLCSWFLVHNFGRRQIYLYSLATLSGLLLIIGIIGCLPAGNMGALWATGGIMILYMFIYMACLGAIAYVVVAEMPTSELRNKTVAISRIFLNLGNFAASWLNPAIINPSAWNLRGKGAFIWAVPCLLTFIWTFFRFPETKGRTFGELDDLFHRGIPARKFKDTVASIAASDSKIPDDLGEKTIAVTITSRGSNKGN